MPRRWVVERFGIPDIHVRQKWAALRPYLEPWAARPLRLLDAGCGPGFWALELAARYPTWTVDGIDIDPAVLEQARQRQAQFGLPNVTFQEADFMTFAPSVPYDAVLSVASAHYLANDGQGPALFRRFHDWLRPGGRLVLLGPRRHEEVPFWRGLPSPQWGRTFTAADLRGFCADAGLEVEVLHGCVGPPGLLAKQLSWMPGKLSRLFYPLQLLCNALDAPTRSPEGRFALWVLVATRKEAS